MQHRQRTRTTLAATLAAAVLVAVPLVGSVQSASSAAAATKAASTKTSAAKTTTTKTTATTTKAASATVSAPKYCSLKTRATVQPAACAVSSGSTGGAAPSTTTGTTSAPVGNVGAFTQSFIENFTTAAAANGPFAKTYANSWQPYADGTSGMYYSGSQVSAHDGYMDVELDGSHGAAGAFGSPNTAWARTGGKFTVRARATGGVGNGAAFMLWPSSNTWSDGEIDYPESNFEDSPMLHQHSMTAGQEVNATSLTTGASWRDWHTYSIEWIPGKSVKYYLDDALISTITVNVPTTAHRWMFQVGNWGATGDLQIDWVTAYSYNG
jgi:hypothetical protein